MKLRNAVARIVFVAAHVAVGYWLVSLSEAMLSNKHTGGESQNTIAPDQVRQVCWSNDNNRLLSVVRKEFGSGGSLVMRDLGNASEQVVLDISRQTFVTAKLSPDGQHLLVAIDDGTLWWVATRSKEHRLLLSLPFPGNITSADLSPDGRQIAAASNDGIVYLIDPESEANQSPRSIFVGDPQNKIANLRFSADGSLLVCSRRSGSISMWDVESEKVLQTWKGHDQAIIAIALLPNDRVISAGLDSTIRLWEIDANSEISKQETGLQGITALAVSDDGKLAAWGGFGRKVVVVWDIEKSEMKHEIPIAASIVWDLQFSHDNKSLAFAGNDGSVRLYDAESGLEKEVFHVRERVDGTFNPC